LQQGVLLVPHPCGEREPVEQWLRLARSQLAMVQALMQTESELRQKLEDRRLIEQAKGRLMRHQGLDEDEAYRLMRSTAMSRHLSLGSWRGNCCRLCPPESSRGQPFWCNCA
jgi:response regulator NasT